MTHYNNNESLKNLSVSLFENNNLISISKDDSSNSILIGKHDLSENRLTELTNNAIASIKRQSEIEATPQKPFEEFRKEYVSQEASRIILEGP